MARVVVFVPYPLGATPSQRFRLEQWAPLLRSLGIELEFRPFATPALVKLLYQPGRALGKAIRLGLAMARQYRQLPGPGDFDVAVVHRAMALVGPAALERRIARVLPLVYDFDDAIHLLHTSVANRTFGWLKFPSKTAEICGLARCVTVGNTYLAEFAGRYARDVTIVPSSVDTATYTPDARPSRGAGKVVGWMGSSTSQTYLEPFEPMLERMTSLGLTLRIISDRRPAFAFPFEWRSWSADTEVADLQAFDVGIMPLPDTEWARGKCAMKILQYMGVGVPSVASDLGGNREVIRDGENGLLATGADEWIGKILSVVNDPQFARRLGMAGRETVVSRYSTDVCARRFAQVLLRAAASGTSRP